MEIIKKTNVKNSVLVQGGLDEKRGKAVSKKPKTNAPMYAWI